MTPEQFAAVLVALAAVLGGIARCIAEVRAYHRAVNSKMDALLELTATSSRAEGRLEGTQTPPPGSGGADKPLGHWSASKRRGEN